MRSEGPQTGRFRLRPGNWRKLSLRLQQAHEVGCVCAGAADMSLGYRSVPYVPTHVGHHMTRDQQSIGNALRVPDGRLASTTASASYVAPSLSLSTTMRTSLREPRPTLRSRLSSGSARALRACLRRPRVFDRPAGVPHDGDIDPEHSNLALHGQSPEPA
jgi:hypothetical protein